VNHKGYPSVVFKMRQSLCDFLSMKSKGGFHEDLIKALLHGSRNFELSLRHLLDTSCTHDPNKV
jgi:hypothetical protein